MMLRLLVVLIVAPIFISSCTADGLVTLPPDAPCEAILHSALLSVPFDEIAQGQEEANQWIVSEFPTATVEFTAWEPSGDGNIGLFRWSQDDKAFELYLLSTNRYLTQLQLPNRFSSRYPTLRHILRCFGTPEYYILEVGVPIGGATLGTILQLWYPDRGIRFMDVSQQYKPPVRYTADSPITAAITITPPGSMEEMLRNISPGAEQRIQQQLAVLKKWPENFTELVVKE
jgi:hypothetical protein